MSNRAAARSPTGQLPTGVRGRKVLARGRQYRQTSGCSQLCLWGPYVCRLGPWARGRRGPWGRSRPRLPPDQGLSSPYTNRHHQEVMCCPEGHLSLALRLSCQPYPWGGLDTRTAQLSKRLLHTADASDPASAEGALTRWTPTPALPGTGAKGTAQPEAGSALSSRVALLAAGHPALGW